MLFMVSVSKSRNWLTPLVLLWEVIKKTRVILYSLNHSSDHLAYFAVFHIFYLQIEQIVQKTLGLVSYKYNGLFPINLYLLPISNLNFLHQFECNFVMTMNDVQYFIKYLRSVEKWVIDAGVPVTKQFYSSTPS